MKTETENNGPSAPQEAKFLTDVVGFFGFNPAEPALPDGDRRFGVITAYEPEVKPVEFRRILKDMHYYAHVVVDKHVAEEVKQRIRQLDPKNKWELSAFESSLDGSVELSFFDYDEMIAERLSRSPAPTAGEIKRMAGYKTSKKTKKPADQGKILESANA